MTLFLVATLVTSLAQQLAVLLLRHALATLLDYGTHKDLNCCSEDDRFDQNPGKIAFPYLSRTTVALLTGRSSSASRALRVTAG